jgi:predicted AlkP superfamily phosphohydrolase/phosphomutase
MRIQETVIAMMINTRKNQVIAVAIMLIVAAGFMIAFTVGTEYQKSQPVDVTLFVFSGTDVIEETVYPMTEKGLLQMGTNNTYTYRNNVTSYGIRVNGARS